MVPPEEHPVWQFFSAPVDGPFAAAIADMTDPAAMHKYLFSDYPDSALPCEGDQDQGDSCLWEPPPLQGDAEEPAAGAELQRELINFLAAFESGRLRPSLRLEAGTEPLADLIAAAPTHFHFVYVFTHWCGFCKAFEPAYQRIVQAFADSTLRIHRIDAMKTDLPPRLAVRGFPAFLLFKEGVDGPAVEYGGERSFEAISTFLELHLASDNSTQ